MVRYRIVHRTTYQYSEHVSLCHNEAQLSPRMTDFQIPRDTRLFVSPQPAVLSERTDYFGNRLFYFAVQSPHNVLEVTSESVVDLLPRTGPAGSNPILPPSPAWETVRDDVRSSWDLFQYLNESTHVRATDAVRQFALVSFFPGRPILEAAWDLNVRIHSEFRYEPGSTRITTTTDEVLRIRKGVCQDFSHLAIACFRSLGLPARYVSGYIESAPQRGQKMQGADASHAWFSVFVSGAGWFDFDPTNRKMPDDQHITVSLGRDYADIAPLKGIVYGGGKSVCKVAVDVMRQESPA